MARTYTFLMRAAAGAGMLLLSQLSKAQPGPSPATQASNSFVVVFNSQALPADAASRVQAAGGTVTATLPSVGVLAAATTVDGATFLQNLRKDTAIQDADYDVLLNLIAPAQIAIDAGVSPAPILRTPGRRSVRHCRRTSSTRPLRSSGRSNASERRAEAFREEGRAPGTLPKAWAPKSPFWIPA